MHALDQLLPAVLCFSPRDQLVPGLITLHGNLSQMTQSRRLPGASNTLASLAKAAIPVVLSVVAELVHLVGPIMAIRPAVTALLHRTLLFPVPEKREKAIQFCLKKVLVSWSALGGGGGGGGYSTTMHMVTPDDCILKALKLAAVRKIYFLPACGDTQTQFLSYNVRIVKGSILERSWIMTRKRCALY